MSARFDLRKNLERLIDAYAQVAQRGDVREHLVIAGQPGWRGGVSLEHVPPALRDRVHHVGYVADSDLPSLYAGATVFTYPSLMEGFGFPPLEAMACGIPVIASNLSVLRENLEEAACLISLRTPNPSPPRSSGWWETLNCAHGTEEPASNPHRDTGGRPSQGPQRLVIKKSSAADRRRRSMLPDRRRASKRQP